MPIVSKIRTAFIKEGQPHRGSQPTKALCRARCLRSWVAPLRCPLSSDGGKGTKNFLIGNGFGVSFFVI